MPTYRLTLAYDGGGYAGWQKQRNRTTVQAAFERAVQAVIGAGFRAAASGRTDAGVHALGQVVSLSAAALPPPETLLRALNATLPADIRVLAACAAADGFHAIRDARRKRYRYVIDDAPVSDPFARGYAWRVRQRLDAGAMHRAGQALLGTHDFASFQSAGSPRRSSVRTMYELSVTRRCVGQGEKVVCEMEADGFLYNMARAVVGSLVEVGRGAREEAWLVAALQARRRGAAGPTAPPQGLFLVEVQYDGPNGGTSDGLPDPAAAPPP